MWEIWLYKTIIAFISMNALKIVFKDFIHRYIKKHSKDKNYGVGFIRSQINTLLTAMIPVVRWIMVILVIICIIGGTTIDGKNDKEC